MASALTKEGYQILQGEFTGWALRQLLETQAIISEEIDPAVWREAQGIIAQEQEEEES